MFKLPDWLKKPNPVLDDERYKRALGKIQSLSEGDERWTQILTCDGTLKHVAKQIVEQLLRDCPEWKGSIYIQHGWSSTIAVHAGVVPLGQEGSWVNFEGGVEKAFTETQYVPPRDDYDIQRDWYSSSYDFDPQFNR